VLRGLESRCAACGAPRFLLAAPALSMAGEPSRFGGIAASVAGVAVLVMGLSLSAGSWFLLQSLVPSRSFGWAVAIPMLAASLLFGLLLLIGGARLRRKGSARRAQVQLAAVEALVRHRPGPLSAGDIARELALPEASVDALLAKLARDQATAVTLDVDARGQIVYDFDGEDRRWRVLEEAAAEVGGPDEVARTRSKN
jgi:hypothetical protein